MDRLAWRVNEFAEALGVSRSKAYEIIARNPGLGVKIGGSIRVPVEKAKIWLAEQAQAGA